MLNNKENIRLINIDTVVIVMIVFFGLLFSSKDSGKIYETKKRPVETTVSFENCALNTPVARLQIYPKTPVSNKDNFSLLAFNINPLYENKRTNIRVSALRTIRQSLTVIPQFILRSHLFPREIDDLPSLS